MKNKKRIAACLAADTSQVSSGDTVEKENAKTGFSAPLAAGVGIVAVIVIAGVVIAVKKKKN